MRLKIQRKPLIHCKILAFLFYLYINWYKPIYGDSTILLYGIAFSLTLFILIDIVMNRIIVSKKMDYILMLCIFAIYSFTTGLFSANNMNVLISACVTLLAFLIVCFDYFYVCERLSDIEWILNTFFITALLCAIQTVFFGEEYDNGVIVITMSQANNPNDLSVVLLFGIFSITAKENFARKHFFVSTILISFISYAIILSGSRKTFLVCLVYLLLWFFKYLNSFNTGKHHRRPYYALGIIVFALLVYEYLSGDFLSTSMSSRLILLIEEGSSNIRFKLYEEAFTFWKRRPLFGIGLGQVLLQSKYQLYSHSSYAEILACSGLVGFLIFYAPFWKRVKWSFSVMVKKDSSYRDNIMAIMLICELLLGIGIIFIYNFTHLIMLFVLFYYIDTYFREMS